MTVHTLILGCADVVCATASNAALVPVQRAFDIVIVDEAANMSEVETHLIANKGGTVVVVGD